MPGYVIHLAVGEEFLRKNKNLKIDKKMFYEGIIAPDGVVDKSQTHYGKSSRYANVKLYLKQNKLDTDYNKGYFLHLISDYVFYNLYFKEELQLSINNKERFYLDYDKINRTLIEKYKIIDIPEKAKAKIFFKEGETKYLSIEKVEKFIEEISNLNIDNTNEIIAKYYK